MTRLELAVEQIVFTRNYTIELLDQTPVAEWFRQPPAGSVTSAGRSVIWRVPSTGWRYGAFEESSPRTAL